MRRTKDKDKERPRIELFCECVSFRLQTRAILQLRVEMVFRLKTKTKDIVRGNWDFRFHWVSLKIGDRSSFWWSLQPRHSNLHILLHFGKFYKYFYWVTDALTWLSLDVTTQKHSDTQQKWQSKLSITSLSIGIERSVVALIRKFGHWSESKNSFTTFSIAISKFSKAEQALWQ